MNQHFLQLYADFIVKVGVNVRPRQNFIVRCPVTMPDFAHACVRAGYEAGAKTVVVRWEDDKLTRLNMEMADEKDLTAMKPYELRSYLDYAEDPDGCCTLAIHAEDPEALAGLDAGKLNRVSLARRTFLKPWQEYTMNDRVQWCPPRAGPRKSSLSCRWRKPSRSCGRSFLTSAAFPPAIPSLPGRSMLPRPKPAATS